MAFMEEVRKADQGMYIFETNAKQMYCALPRRTAVSSIEPVLYFACGDTSDGSLIFPNEILEMFQRDETCPEQWDAIMKDWGCEPLRHFD